jgi:hypothetical protein
MAMAPDVFCLTKYGPQPHPGHGVSSGGAGSSIRKLVEGGGFKISAWTVAGAATTVS